MTTEIKSRPIPHVDDDIRRYFDGARQGELVIQRCTQCQRHIFYPRIACPHCLRMDTLEWTSVSGRGEVYSFCIVHRPQHASFFHDVPIIFAAIKIEDGLVMLSEIRGIEPDLVHIGMSVRVDFIALNEEISVPIWRSTGAS